MVPALGLAAPVADVSEAELLRQLECLHKRLPVAKLRASAAVLPVLASPPPQAARLAAAARAVTRPGDWAVSLSGCSTGSLLTSTGDPYCSDEPAFNPQIAGLECHAGVKGCNKPDRACRAAG